MRKLEKGDGWIGILFQNDVEVYYETDNCDCDGYGFDYWALVKSKRKWYIVGTHGCSCPSHEEQAQIELGPLTKKQLIKEIKAGNYRGYTMPVDEETKLIKTLEKSK